MPKGKWTPPRVSKEAPERAKHVMAKVYAHCRDRNPAETKAAKAKCARIAWAATKWATGYKPGKRK
jgi:hypothetical protein